MSLNPLVAIPLAKCQCFAGRLAVFIPHCSCHAAHASTERPAAFGGFRSGFEFRRRCCDSGLQLAAGILGTI